MSEGKVSRRNLPKLLVSTARRTDADPVSPGWTPRFTPKATRRSKPSDIKSDVATVEEESSPASSARTIRIVLGLWLGYGFYNTMRRTYPQQMPAIAAELQIPVGQIGTPNSMFAATYGFAKLLGSVASDHVPCPEFHALGLLLCGLDVAALGLCRGLHSLTLLWGLQGLLQAFGWPLLARIIVSELPQQDRGKYWGVLSMAGNIGQLVTPYGMILATWMGLSWRGAFFAAGSCALAMAVAVWLLLCCGRPCHGSSVVSNADRRPKPSASAYGLFNSLTAVVYDPALLTLMLCNLLGYFVHRSTAEWGVVYLKETGLANSQMQTATLMFWLEVGGSVGAFSSGYVASYIGGRPGFTTVASALMCTIAMGMLTLSSYSASGTGSAPLTFTSACVLQFVAGVGLNGVRCMVGFHAATISAAHGNIGMANGFMEIVGQMGSVIAGQPLGALASTYENSQSGWVFALGAVTLASATVFVLNMFLLPCEARRLAGSAKSKVE